MSIDTGKQLVNMYRTGWNAIVSNPTIARADFKSLLEGNTQFTMADWTLGFDILTELGYFDGTENWVLQRVWVTEKTPALRRVLLKASIIFFKVSPSAQLKLLQAQRAVAIAERNTVRDAIQDAYLPFVDVPPVGTADRVVTAVSKVVIPQARNQRDRLNEIIASLDVQIAELQA